MKIELYEGGVRRIRLRLPTGLIFSSPAANLAADLIRKTLDGKDEVSSEVEALEELGEGLAEDSLPETAPAVDRESLKSVFAELRRFSRRHPGFVLAEVEDEEGDGVKITL